jgi:hypothetical protein
MAVIITKFTMLLTAFISSVDLKGEIRRVSFRKCIDNIVEGNASGR